MMGIWASEGFIVRIKGLDSWIRVENPDLLVLLLRQRHRLDGVLRQEIFSEENKYYPKKFFLKKKKAGEGNDTQTPKQLLKNLTEYFL